MFHNCNYHRHLFPDPGCLRALKPGASFLMEEKSQEADPQADPHEDPPADPPGRQVQDEGGECRVCYQLQLKQSYNM